MQRIVIIASAFGLLIASGAVHGVWTERWSAQADLTETAQRLEKLPMTVGPWHGSVVEMEPNANMGLAGMMARRYIHATSGKSVTLLLACGRPGPVCTHTPDVCYAGSGYEVEKPRRFALPLAAGQKPPEFWTARFVRERPTGKTHLRIFWSWLGSETWQVADNPRLSFAGEKLLYKMYLIREMTTPDEPMESDACVEFMHDVLPAFRQFVLQ